MQPPKRDDSDKQEYWRHRPNKGGSPQVNSSNSGAGHNRPQNNNNGSRNNSAKKEGREAQNTKQNSNNLPHGNNNPGSSSKPQQQVTPKIVSKTADNQPSSSGPSSGRGGKQDGSHVAELFKTPSSAKPNASKQGNNAQQQQPSITDDSTPTRGANASQDDKKNAPLKKAQETPQNAEKDSPSMQRSAKATGANNKAESESRSQKKRYKALIGEIPPETQAKLKENLVTITDKHDKLGFHCDPCSCNFTSLEEINQHIDSFWLHLYKKQLRKNPPPKVTLPNEHAQKLTEAIEEIFLENSAQENDYIRWMKIASELQSRLVEVLETVKVEPAGLQGCHLAMKSDILNLCLSSSDGKPTNSARLLANLFQNPDLSARCGLVFENSLAGDDNLRLIRRATYTFSGESDPVPITLSVMCLDPVTKSLLDLYRKHQPELLPRLSITFQYWAKCVGFFEHNVLIPEALAVMTVHFMQHCPQPLFPILSPSETTIEIVFKSLNQSSIGQLWVSMLHYFSFGFPYDKYAIDIVSPRGNFALRDPEAKHSNRRRLFVNTAHQDVQQRFNLARLLKPDLMFDFFHDRIMCAFRYFSTLPENRVLVTPAAVANLTERLEKVALTTTAGETNEDLCREVWVSQLVNGVVASSIDHVAIPESDGVCKELAAKVVAEVISEALLTLANDEPSVEPAPPQPPVVAEKPFVFSRKVFLSNPTVVFPVACNYCGTTEHHSSACKRILWTKPDPLPPMIDPFMRKLDQAIQSVAKDMSNWPDWSRQIDAVVNDVMSAIKDTHPDARLHLYGSCRNGFQVWPCDVDLCLTFNGVDGVPADQVERVLVTIKKLLQKSRRFVMTIAVTSCRVPVVKFVHRETELEGDICLYNQLALHNTKLLQTYSALDERCRMLGLLTKHIFKQADICDASRGFLSSYAYILMVIFYLQHRSPAVLPCLQQMAPATSESTGAPGNNNKRNNNTQAARTPRIVDGWDTWFFEDSIEATRSAWSGFGLNKESIGSLWLGFLRFYTEQFDLANQVVAIRQLEPLLKLEKSIDTHVLAIEDPFNLSHNLGSGLRATAYAHIMKVFVKSRAHFGTPMETLPPGQKSWEKYLLDPNQYSVADGPTGFQCHFCKCVGHTYAKCERRLAALEEEKEEHQRMQRLRMEQQMQMQQAAALMGVTAAGASPRVVPYQRPLGPGAPRQPNLANQARSIDAENANSGVPLPINAILSPNKAQQEQLEKMGVPAPSKVNGDPAVAQALAQLYPDLVGANKVQSQNNNQPNSGQPHGATSPTPLPSAFLSSMTSTLTPLLIDCHAHRQSLLSMNQVLTQLYAALTMLTNQLEQTNQQQGQTQPGQQQQMTQQLTVVVDQLRTGIGAFCGHVVQCCHHFDTQISSPVLQLASQVYQQQQVIAASSSSSSTPNSGTTPAANNQPPAQNQQQQTTVNTTAQQSQAAGTRMQQQLQQLLAIQAAQAAAANGPAPPPPGPGGLSFPQLQQWLQQNQNVPAPSTSASLGGAGSVVNQPRFPSLGLGGYADQNPPTSLAGPNHPPHNWPPHSQQSSQAQQPHPTLFGFPMSFASGQPPTSTPSTSQTTGGSESAATHNQNVFPNTFQNQLFGAGEKPQ